MSEVLKPKGSTTESPSSYQPCDKIDFGELGNVLDSLPEDQKQIVVQSIIAARSESFSGPLPHPELLRKYEEAFPGAAERIFKIAEKEQEHRIKYDNNRLGGALIQSKRGQWMGFSLCILFGALAFAMAYLGYPALAGVIGGGTIVSLAIVFVLNKEPKHREDHGQDRTL